MPKNSSISSSKTPPRAFLAALGTFLAINLLVQAAFQSGYLKDQDDYLKRRAEYGAHEAAPVLLIGDSTVRMVQTPDLESELKLREGDVLAASFGGAVPRTLRWYFESTEYRNTAENSLCVLFVTPMQLNYHNRLFERTLDAAFAPRAAFTELLLGGRWANLRYYLLEDFLPIRRYRNQFKTALKEKMTGSSVPQAGIDPLKASSAPATEEEMQHWLSVYQKESLGPAYRLDPYQLASLREIVSRLADKKVRLVFVVPPLSPGVIQLTGDEALGGFLTALRTLADEYKAPLFDYSRENKGYKFQDAVHLVLSSRKDFSARLCAELKKRISSAS